MSMYNESKIKDTFWSMVRQKKWKTTFEEDIFLWKIEALNFYLDQGKEP